MSIAQLIKNNNQTPAVAKIETPKMHVLELFSRDTDIFDALYAKLTQAFPLVVTIKANPPEHSLAFDTSELLLMDAGVALFCARDETLLAALRTFGESIIKNVRAQLFDSLPMSGALKTVILARDFGDTCFTRQVVTDLALQDMLASRVMSLNEQHHYECEHNRIKEITVTALHQDSCTLAREINYVVDAVSLAYQGVDVPLLHSLITEAADQTSAVYRDKHVLELGAARVERHALSSIIDKCTESTLGQAKLDALSADFRLQLQPISDRNTVVLNHWEESRQALAKKLLDVMPMLERNGLKQYAATSHHVEQEKTLDPVWFEGIDIQRTLTPSFHVRLSLSSMVDDNNCPTTVLAGAIMAQIGGFIEMKKTAMLIEGFRACADQMVIHPCLCTVGAQKAVIDIKSRVINTML